MAMMKVTSPYLTEFAVPIRPDMLPSQYQHPLLKCMQALIEEALFYFAQRWMPQVLRKRGWEVPEDGELNNWWNQLRNAKIPASSVSFPKGCDVETLFRRVSHLRHAAVHRLRTPVDVIKRMMQDAMAIVAGLGDNLRRMKLECMQIALHSNDLISLEKAVSTPLHEIQTSNSAAQLPTQIARPALAINDNIMTTMASLAQVQAQGRAAENIPLRRRSASPVREKARSYRERDQAARRPSMGTSNTKRTASTFIDLTEDSDDEVPVFKPPRTQHSAPAEFIDLTAEE
jgi:hypothetical protein